MRCIVRFLLSIGETGGTRETSMEDEEGLYEREAAVTRASGTNEEDLKIKTIGKV